MWLRYILISPPVFIPAAAHQAVSIYAGRLGATWKGMPGRQPVLPPAPNLDTPTLVFRLCDTETHEAVILAWVGPEFGRPGQDSENSHQALHLAPRPRQA
jgi:hypothetical protein